MVSPPFQVATMGVLTGSRDKAGRLWSLPYRPDVEVAAADAGGISEFHDAEAGVLQLLDERLKANPERVDINIKADRSLPYEVVKKLVVALETRFGRGVIEARFR